MGWQTYKQKNGNYCVWSSIVDNFIAVGCTKEELKELYAENIGRETLDEHVKGVIERADKGIKNNLAPDFPAECFYWIRKRHGIKELQKVKKLFKGKI